MYEEEVCLKQTNKKTAVLFVKMTNAALFLGMFWIYLEIQYFFADKIYCS